MVEMRFIKTSNAKSARAAVTRPVANISRPDMFSGLEGHRMNGNAARINSGISFINHASTGDRMGRIGLNSSSSVGLGLRTFGFFFMVFHPSMNSAPFMVTSAPARGSLTFYLNASRWQFSIPPSLPPNSDLHPPQPTSLARSSPSTGTLPARADESQVHRHPIDSIPRFSSLASGSPRH